MKSEEAPKMVMGKISSYFLGYESYNIRGLLPVVVDCEKSLFFGSKFSEEGRKDLRSRSESRVESVRA